MKYLFSHTALYNGHFSWFHLIIILVAVALIVYWYRKIKDLKEKRQDLETKLVNLDADEAMIPPDEPAAEAEAPATGD